MGSFALYVILCGVYVGALGENVGIREVPLEGLERVRVLECFSNTKNNGFIGLSLYNTRNRSEALVLFLIRSHECKTSTKDLSVSTASEMGSCSFDEDGMITLKFLDELKEGETKSYGCEMKYFDSVLKREASFINITMPLIQTSSTVAASATTEATEETTAVSQEIITTDSWTDSDQDNTTTQAATTDATSPLQTEVSDSGRPSEFLPNASIIAVGVCAFFAAISVLMVIVMSTCCHRSGKCCVCRHTQKHTPSRGEAGKQDEPIRRPRTVYPIGGSVSSEEASYQYALSSHYLTPTYLPALPLDRPRRHRFRPITTISNSSSTYAVVL